MADLEPGDIRGYILPRAEHQIFRGVVRIGQRFLPRVAQPAAHIWRHIEDQRSGAQVGKDDVIRCGRVGRENPEPVVIGQDLSNFAIPRPERRLTTLPLRKRDSGDGPEIRLAGALEVSLVVQRLDGFFRRISRGEVVCKRQLADPRVDGPRVSGTRAAIVCAAHRDN